MGKVLQIVGTIALNVAAVLTANPLLAHLAIAADINLATSTLAELTAPKAPDLAGTQVDWQADPAAGVPYWMGRTGFAGNIALVDTCGDKHKYLHYTTVLSGGGPMTGLDGFTGNAVALTFTADGGEGNDGYYRNRMWWKASLGATPAPHLTFTSTGSKDTPANHSGVPPSWGGSAKLSGLAHDIYTLEFDPAIYSGGVPKPMRVGRGVKVYDPRKDSTYPGGAGAHRWADPSDTAGHDAARATWEYSENPHLHGLHWCLGRWERDVSNSAAKYVRTLGVGAPISGIDVAAFVQGANVNDANGHKVGGVVYSTDSKWEVLTAILQAGASRPLKLAAQISCLPQTPRVSLDTWTGDELVDTASVQGSQATRDRVNAIWPRYREEAQGWEVVPTAAPVTVAAYETIDGGRRTKEASYPLCQDAAQASTLARYDIEDAREIGPISLPSKPRWMGLKPGDCFTVTEPELGLNGQKVLILNRSQDPASMAVTLTVRSETDGKHAFALGQTGAPPPSPALTGIDPVQVSTPPAADWGAIGGASTSTSGQSLPVIVVTGGVSDANVADVIVEFRLASGTTWAEWASPKAAETVTTTITGLAPQTSYVVGVRYRSVRGQVGATRLELAAVTTGGVATDWGSVTNPLSKKPEDNATVGAKVGTGGNLVYVPTTAAPVVLAPADVITSLGAAAALTADGGTTRTFADIDAALQNASDAVTAADGLDGRTTTLELRASASRGNLVKNPSFGLTQRDASGASQVVGWTINTGYISTATSDPFAPYLYFPPPDNTASYMDLADQTFPCAPGQYSAQANIYAGGLTATGTQWARVVLFWRDASSTIIGSAVVLQVAGGNTWTLVKSDGRDHPELTAPAGTTQVSVRADVYASSGNIRATQNVGYARIKLESGEVCSVFSDDQIGATVSSESDARASQAGALATRVDTVQARVQGRKNLIRNPRFVIPISGDASDWTLGAGAVAGTSDPNGPFVVYAPADNTATSFTLATQFQSVYAGAQYSIQALMYSAGLIDNGGSFFRVVVVWIGSGFSNLGQYELQTNRSTGWAVRYGDGSSDARLTAPAGTLAAGIRIDVAAVSGNVRTNGGNVAATNVKLEAAASCGVFSDEALSASVVETSTAVALIDGTQAAEWKVGVVAGATTGEVALGAIEKRTTNPDGTQTVTSTSAFRVRADAFEIESPTTGAKLTFTDEGGGLLSVNNLVAKAANIGALSVDTLSIKNNAVGNAQIAPRSVNNGDFGDTTVVGHHTISPGSEQELCRATINCHGAPVRVDVSLLVRTYHADSNNFYDTYYEIRRNGVLIFPDVGPWRTSKSSVGYPYSTFMIDHSPGGSDASPVTNAYQFVLVAAGATVNIETDYRAIVAVELRDNR